MTRHMEQSRLRPAPQAAELPVRLWEGHREEGGSLVWVWGSERDEVGAPWGECGGVTERGGGGSLG